MTFVCLFLPYYLQLTEHLSHPYLNGQQKGDYLHTNLHEMDQVSHSLNDGLLIVH